MPEKSVDDRPPDDAVHASYQRLIRAEPVWDMVAPLAELRPDAGRTLLHAGPPIRDPGTACTPILNAAAAAAVFEGWADDTEEAREALRRGEITLSAAQDHGVVTPLAFVVSPTMWVQRVRDAAGSGAEALSPLNDGPPRGALRFGDAGEGRAARLEMLRDIIGPALAAAVHEPIPMLPVGRAGLHGGDDIHAEVAATNGAILRVLDARIGSGGAADYLASAGQFVVNLWMATCGTMLNAAAGVPESRLVVGAGGNGRTFGLRLASAPGRWLEMPAPTPAGGLLDPAFADVEILPAIGDSAVIDACGFGAMAMRHAPAVAKMMAPHLPAGFVEKAGTALIGPHPAFIASGARVGLDAARLTATGGAAVNLAMIDADGEKGLVGRGTCLIPTP